MPDTQSAHAPIAVVGVSAIFPGSSDKTGFWRDIVRGADLLSDVPETHWLVDDYYDPDPTATDKTYARRGGFLSAIDFDPAEAGLPPKLMPSTDTSQLLALIAAKRVLEDAFPGARLRDVPRDRIGIVLGVTGAQELAIAMAARLQHPIWRKAMTDSGMEAGQIDDVIGRIRKSFPEWTEASFPGLLGNVVAGRVANRLDLHGPNCVTDAACASALAAVSMAVSDLQLGRADVVITGGVDTMNDVFMYVCFSKTPALSRTGDCRPFSSQADGTMLGEGLALFALKRLADAERDGDRIYSVIRGIGASSDGKAKSVYAPLPEGQARSLRRAYEEAGYSPATVGLVEAHGTGTVAGDAAEFAGLRSVFGAAGRDDKQWCALGSVKSQIGHTKAAAGAAGMFKAAMALHHKVLPPTIKITEPNPELDLPNSPFYLSTRARPWIHGAPHPRRASVSSFGFGGSNFHVALEEYTGPAAHPPRLRHHAADLLAFSGASAGEVIAAARAAAATLTDAGAFVRLARETQGSFDPARAVRLLLVADSAADARQKLEQAALRIERAPDRDAETPDGVYYACSAPAQRVGVIFPGQGSQRLYMGSEVAIAFPEAQAVWDAAVASQRGATPSLDEVVMPRPAFGEAAVSAQEARLTATEWTQPALAAASLATWRVLSRLGLPAFAVAGHSFGEVTALHVAGVLGEEDLLHVARERGRAMSEAAAATPGAMAAVACSHARLAPLLSRFGLDVRVANHNAPEQLVIAGPTEAVAGACQRLAAEGITAQPLNVATAFHSPVVERATEPFRRALQAVPFGPAVCAVYANASAEPYPGDPGAQRDLLAGQIARPVRFVEMIERMAADGVDLFVEVGPDAVLTRLVGRILEGRPHRAVATDRKGRDGLTQLLHAVAQLGAAGVPLKLAALWDAYEAPAAAPPPADKKRLLVPVRGNNYGKPYPPPPGTPVAPPYRPATPRVAAQPVAAAALPSPAPRPQQAAPVVVPAPAPVAAAARAPMVAPVSLAPVAPAPPAQRAYPVAAPPAHAPDLQHAWLEAIERVQSRAVEAHATFQRSLVESHQAFLRSTEASLFGLAALAGEAAPGAALPVAFAAPAQLQAAPASAVAPAPLPVASPSVVSRPAPAPVVAPAPPVAARAAAPVPAPVAPPAPPVAPRAAVRDLTALLAGIVADKTGYPAEMLRPEMALEADLGIDSIKRVEILSAMREAVPELPALDPKALGTLQTLGEVADKLRSSLGDAPAPAAPTSPVAAAPAAAPARDVMALLAGIVADKTGYPAEMLRPEMALEADLGIDSIKRVEILSAMREAVPELPALDPKALGTLQTLGEVADKLRGSLPAVAAVAPLPAAVPAAPVAAPARDVMALLASIVADKTGYPAEMLRPEMALEADLGIDSIKRVEILSAMRDAVPELPALDPKALGTLQTLGEVADKLRGSLPAVAAASLPAAVLAAPVATPARDVMALLASIVADKTGYPAEMLRPEMALEADLGIDSIKRVEILSAMRDAVPELPALDPKALGTLQTLGEVADKLRGSLGGKVHGAAANGAAPAAPAATAKAPAARVPRLVVDWVARAAPGLAMPALFACRRIVVVDDAGGVGVELARHLAALGLPAVAMAAVDDEADGVIDVRALDPVADAAQATQVMKHALQLARAIAPRLSERGGAYVVALPLPEEQPWLAGLTALARTAALEWPAARVRSIACGGLDRPAHAVAADLLRELADGGPDEEVAIGAGARRVRRLVETGHDGGDPHAPGPAGHDGGDPHAPGPAGHDGGDPHAPGATGHDGGDPHAPGPAGHDGGDPHAPGATGRSGLRLGHGDIVVVSGGGRGVTASCAIALAAASPGAHFVLLGRSTLAEEPERCRGVADGSLARALAAEIPQPAALRKRVDQIKATREISRTLAALRAAGATAAYEPVDVADAASVGATLDRVRHHHGPITAVVHGAGVIADKPIAEKTDEQMDRVLGTKVSGLAALLAATRTDPLRALVLFSSIAGRTGNIGQCDYAMANAVLNAVAVSEHARRAQLGQACVVKSIGWGPWEGGMVTPGLAAHFERLGVPLIPLDAGAHAFVAECLEARPGEVDVLLGVASGAHAPAAVRRPWEAAVVLHPSTHGFLRDHQLRGNVVVPVVMAIEWCARAASAVRPDLAVTGLHDVSVFRGIKLGAFVDAARPEAVTVLRITAEQISNGDGARVRVTITDLADRPHYRCEVALDGHGERAPLASLAGRATPGAPFGGLIYDGHALFHGPAFQVLDTVDGVDGEAASAQLRGARFVDGWPAGGWETDPAAMDGALQLAVLFAREKLGGAMLPSRVGHVRRYQPGLARTALRGVVTGRDVQPTRVLSDVALVDADGRLFVELSGVETHLRPDEGPVDDGAPLDRSRALPQTPVHDGAPLDRSRALPQTPVHDGAPLDRSRPLPSVPPR